MAGVWMAGAVFSYRLAFCRSVAGRSRGGTSPGASAGAGGGGALGLVPSFGLAARFLAGLSREGRSFFTGLSLGDSFLLGPLPGALRCACDGLFFLAGGAGLAGLGLSPRPKRRCKN